MTTKLLSWESVLEYRAYVGLQGKVAPALSHASGRRKAEDCPGWGQLGMGARLSGAWFACTTTNEFIKGDVPWDPRRSDTLSDQPMPSCPSRLLGIEPEAPRGRGAAKPQAGLDPPLPTGARTGAPAPPGCAHSPDFLRGLRVHLDALPEEDRQHPGPHLRGRGVLEGRGSHSPLALDLSPLLGTVRPPDPFQPGSAWKLHCGPIKKPTPVPPAPAHPPGPTALHPPACTPFLGLSEGTR